MTGASIRTVRVSMPAHLRTLAGVSGDVTVDLDGAVTRRSILDALETKYPMLRGTIRKQFARAQAVLEILCLRRGHHTQVGGRSAAGGIASGAKRFMSSAQSRAVEIQRVGRFTRRRVAKIKLFTLEK